MRTETTKIDFVICVENTDADDLDLWKVYRQIPDALAAEDNYIRVVDESGEDYLYPDHYFVSIELPLQAERAMLKAL